MDRTVLSHQRKGHHRRAGRNLPTACRPVFGYFTDELVAEDDLLVGAHESVVAGLHHDRRQLIAGPAGVEIGAADPAPEHPEQHLASGWLGIGNVRGRQRTLVTNHRFHRLDPSRSGGEQALTLTPKSREMNPCP